MRQLCEDFKQIDIRKIDFKLGTQCQYPPPSGIAMAVINGTVRVVHGFIVCSAQIDYTRCNYGGWRPWFLCPGCGDRRAVLYYSTDNFGCRRCMRLNHASTIEDKFDRLRRKGSKLDARLREFESNPKWKRWGTFERLYWQRLKAEHEAVVWLASR